MVDARVYGTCSLVQVYNSISHNDSVTVVPSSTYMSRRLDKERTSGFSHLPIVVRQHRGL
jgi:hypothetical protein